MKRLLIFAGSLPGAFAILFASVSRQLIESSNVEEINKFLEYMSYADNSLQDSSLLSYAMFASEHYYWILLGGILWLLVFMFLWNKQGGKKNVKK